MTYRQAHPFDRDENKKWDYSIVDLIYLIAIILYILIWIQFIRIEISKEDNFNICYGTIVSFNKHYIDIDTITKHTKSYLYYIKYIDQDNNLQVYKTVYNVNLINITKIKEDNYKHLYIIQPLYSETLFLLLVINGIFAIILPLIMTYWDNNTSLFQCIYKTLKSRIQFWCEDHACLK